MSLDPIRPFLDRRRAIQLVHSLIFSGLDYCHSLLIHIPKKPLKILQKVINLFYRFVIPPPLVSTHLLTSINFIGFRSPREFISAFAVLFMNFSKNTNQAYLVALLTPSTNVNSRNSMLRLCPLSSTTLHDPLNRFNSPVPGSTIISLKL